MAPRDERIGPTAHFTAYVWYRLGLPHAPLFATPLGAALYWGFHPLGERVLPRLAGGTTMTQYLELRHRWIDGALSEEEPDLVVELGAGLSRRGVTFAARGVRYVELDLPRMIALEQRLLERRASAALKSRLKDRLAHVVADASSQGFDRALSDVMRGARRPIVVAEGLLGYFPPAERAKLVGAVTRALDGRGAFVFELRTRADDAGIGPAVAVVKGTIGLVTRGRSASEELAGPDDVRRLLAERGLGDAELLAQERVPHLAHIRPATRVWRARPRA